MQYLVEFGEIYDVQGGLTSFLQTADRDLICEVFHEILDAWKKYYRSSNIWKTGKLDVIRQQLGCFYFF